MEENRTQEILRDPTLEQPTLTYHEVRMPWQSFFVRSEVAARVMAAVQGLHRTDWVRIDTVTGSVAFVRTEHVVFVREWTPEQRASERTFWDALDAERAEDDPPEDQAAPSPADGPMSGPPADAKEDTAALAVALVAVALVAIVAASVTSWAWMAVAR
jgi:hypothetical protein